MIQFGRVKSFNGARVVVALTGFDGDGVIEALLLQPCGVKSPSVWMPPTVGDVVVVAYDEERPENSVVLGVTYPDGKTPPKAGGGEIALQANKVYLGDDVSKTKPCPRDDLIQSQLSAIKSELDAFATAYSSHTHVCAAVGSPSASPAPSHSNSYTVGTTASDSVEVK